MDKRPYEAPKVFQLGKVSELTQGTAEEDKCSGSGDTFVPSPPLPPVSPDFGFDCN